MNVAISTIVGWISAVVSLTALITFWSTRRQAILDQGAKEEKVRALKSDLEEAFDRLRVLEGCRHTADVDMEGMKKDIEYIKKGIDEIKASLARGGKE